MIYQRRNYKNLLKQLIRNYLSIYFALRKKIEMRLIYYYLCLILIQNKWNFCISYINDDKAHFYSFSSNGYWITIKNRFLSGATIISCLLDLTLKKVKSFIGSISLTTDLAFFANSVTFYAYCLGAVSFPLDYIVDLRNLPFSSTISSPFTPLWFLILAILSSTSAILVFYLNL